MACINPDGSLSAVARRVLVTLDRPRTMEDLRAATALPQYRLRATLREIGEAGLVEPAGDGWQATDLGREALRLDAEARALGH